MSVGDKIEIDDVRIYFEWTCPSCGRTNSIMTNFDDVRKNCPFCLTRIWMKLEVKGD